MDRYLDTTRLGPAFLRRPEVADLVVAAGFWAWGFTICVLLS